MAKLIAWVRKHLVFRPGREKQSADQLPFLSSPRRPITPTSFGTPTCLLFQLPYDIRSIITFIAFGGRTFHVDVVHQEGTWQWRGGVCIRNRPELLPSMRYGWLGPCFDLCTREMDSCKRTGKTSNAHDIGIMGFLLSCRQAYTEGIDILYSANCISIKTEPLLLHLPKLILHDRLASITSLEMIVEAHDAEQENGRASFKLDHLEPILDNVVTHCRHLRRLCLSFTVWQRHGHDLLDGPALPLVDAFWRSTQLRNMRVELPTRDYSAATISEPMIDHPREAPIKRLFGRSRWRSLDSEEPKIQYRSIERYPYPPLKLPVVNDGVKSEESLGYWICEGHEGLHPGYHNCGVPYFT
ncbi:hypothetical protein P153DRAFT_370244 [Dothidotthia symphoricarpi CBS 119687]|uniref:DUF7730 domain-containing protein n=1 Tax=Dothidotthia symphoricarpi CBS 119687 TaxID=1392245 RepID=A0A6A6A1S6_9PLEO|nr:uncharacterized protein P153DRAFT_370244 [Dothidotthia symphoricarpi CBS 119687]KAF2124897.1 hypothetical protein P153DRAFT_370244 [Dothidotthia symphoricarpi CBS 119687]